MHRNTAVVGGDQGSRGGGPVPTGWAVRFGVLCIALVTPACADDLGPRWVEDLRFSPDSLYLDVGDTAHIEVFVLDQDGERFDPVWVDRIDWSVGGTGELEVAAEPGRGPVVVAVAEGAALLTGALGRARPAMPVWIRPVGLDQVRFSENPFRASSMGRRAVSVQMIDTAGVVMNPVRFDISWSLQDTTLVTMLGPARSASASLWGQSWLGDGRVRREGRTTLTATINGEAYPLEVVVTPEPVEPTAAPALSVLPGRGLELVWRSSLYAQAGYRVTRSTSPTGGWVEVRPPSFEGPWVLRDTTFVDDEVEAGVRYYYRLQGCNLWGCAVVPSDTVSGVFPTPGGE